MIMFKKTTVKVKVSFCTPQKHTV